MIISQKPGDRSSTARVQHGLSYPLIARARTVTSIENESFDAYENVTRLNNIVCHFLQLFCNLAIKHNFVICLIPLFNRKTVTDRSENWDKFK